MAEPPAPAAPTFSDIVRKAAKPSKQGPADSLAEQVRVAMRLQPPIVLVHAWGVPFETFFGVTPKDLLLAGIYRDLAIPLMAAGPHEAVSMAMLAR